MAKAADNPAVAKLSPLARELGKKRNFDVPEEEAYLNLLRTSALLANHVERLFRPHGLSESTYNALRILRGAGEGGLTMNGVGQRLVAPVPDVTRVIDALERAGLAERRRCEKDRRVVYAAVTAQGLALLKKLDEPARQIHRDQLGHLTRAELDELNRLMVKVRDANRDETREPADAAAEPSNSVRRRSY